MVISIKSKELSKILNYNEWYSIAMNSKNEVVVKNDTTEDINISNYTDSEIKNFLLKSKKRTLWVYSVANNEDIDLHIIRNFNYHTHSEFSLLDGSIRVKDIITKAPLFGAITDHGSLTSAYQFYSGMLKAKKKPVLGCEVYCGTINGNLEGNHLVLLAKNYIGWKNLMKLASNYDNFYKKPHITYELLEKHSEGLIATSACLGGELPQSILNSQIAEAEEVILKMKNIFRDDYYIEIQRHNMNEEKRVNPVLEKLARKHGVKVVAANDAHYTEESDREAHQVLLCIQTKKTIDDPSKMSFDGIGYHIYSEDEFEEIFADKLEYVDNTVEIARKCSDFYLETGNIYMPEFEDNFKKENQLTSAEYFELKCWEGLKEKLPEKAEDLEYVKRLEYEVQVIKKMQYTDYFLITWDFVKYAKDNGIAVGPGRGSAAGSLVAYCLGITNIDPIPLGLIFERFLNPERVSMPDIDVDFDDERRSELFTYIKEKYGEEKIGKIITFGTMAARAAIKDVGKVLGYPYAFAHKIAGYVPKTPGIKIAQALEENLEFFEEYNRDSDVKRIVDLAKKIEGLARHSSVHACGVVIAPSKVSDYVPQARIKNSEGEYEFCTQFTMEQLEDLGLLKMDFLSLKNLNTITGTLKRAGIKHKDINIYDKEVYKFLAKGNLLGIFQLESPGMTGLMKQLFKNIEDVEDTRKLFERVIAGISLYRPGPMDSIPDYLDAIKNKTSYEIPQLEPVLNTTYGQIVYQEQVMQIVRDLAKYPLARSDLVRKAMGKKKLDVMAEEKEYFINGKTDKAGVVEIEGCVRNGIPKEKATLIWDKMADFAKYAFNKSHAAAYAVVALETAYLKLYYSKEFMCALLNSYIDKTDKFNSYVNAVSNMGLQMLPPCVNNSQVEFSVEGESVRFGLKGIRSAGALTAEIIKDREKNGKFKDTENFIFRLLDKGIEKSSLEGLIYSGALDSLDSFTRRSKIKKITEADFVGNVKKNQKKVEKNKVEGQISFFDTEFYPETQDYDKSNMLDLSGIKEYSIEKILEKEKEFTNIYITEHPLDRFEKAIEKEKVVSINELIEEEEENNETNTNSLFQLFDVDDKKEDGYFDGDTVKVAGLVKDITLRYHKQGRNQGKAFKIFQLEDKTGEIKCLIFSQTLEVFKDEIKEGKPVILEGTLKKGQDNCIFVNKVVMIEKLSSEKMYIKCSKAQIQSLKYIFDSAQEGESKVVIEYIEDGVQREAKKKVDLSFELFLELKKKYKEKFQLI